MMMQTRWRLLIGICITVVLSAGSLCIAAKTVEADLGGGAYVHKTFNNATAGPDTLKVTATRAIKSVPPGWAFPEDTLQIQVTGNEGNTIIAATATGRNAGSEALYIVKGVFVGGPSDGGGTTETHLAWEAKYTTEQKRLQLWVNSLSPDDDNVLVAENYDHWNTLNVELCGQFSATYNAAECYPVTLGDSDTGAGGPGHVVWPAIYDNPSTNPLILGWVI